MNSESVVHIIAVQKNFEIYVRIGKYFESLESTKEHLNRNWISTCCTGMDGLEYCSSLYVTAAEVFSCVSVSDVVSLFPYQSQIVSEDTFS